MTVSASAWKAYLSCVISFAATVGEVLYELIQRIRFRLRGVVVAAFIRAGGGHVGRRLEVEAGVSLKHAPHPGLRFGDRVHFARGVVIDVPQGAALRIGNGVKVMQYTVIAAGDRIEIGDLTQIAESCSIRDSDHGITPDAPMADQLVSTPTTIGSDAWIGRGCAVLRGATVGDGAVIGANSVVKGSIPAMTVAVGSPARVVRTRGDGEALPR